MFITTLLLDLQFIKSQPIRQIMVYLFIMVQLLIGIQIFRYYLNNNH